MCKRCFAETTKHDKNRGVKSVRTQHCKKMLLTENSRFERKMTIVSQKYVLIFLVQFVLSLLQCLFYSVFSSLLGFQRIFREVQNCFFDNMLVLYHLGMFFFLFFVVFVLEGLG